MLNKLCRLVRRYDMLQPGDHLICALSGGADSIALLFAMYLLREKLGITLSAAHFNHNLRGLESDRDEEFVRDFCSRYDIPLFVGNGDIVSGKKGLEAAAREARYAFFGTLSGKIATAHTANDNLETVLMHLVRGTGLKGLGGIAPVNGNVIRPMLEITRSEILSFIDEYCLSYVTDSTNEEDIFLRNRLRKEIIPLLERENPSLAINTTALAQRLRQDEAALQRMAEQCNSLNIYCLMDLEPAVRRRVICKFLQKCGISEPESKHILGVENLIFSDRPSAAVSLRNGAVISRCYDQIECVPPQWKLEKTELLCPGVTRIPEAGISISCGLASGCCEEKYDFAVSPVGNLCVRHRLPGDNMRLSGGHKELKKLFIDRKIPVVKRLQIPVIADELGVIAVCGIGPNLDRLSCSDDAIWVRIEFDEKKEEDK